MGLYGVFEATCETRERREDFFEHCVAKVRDDCLSECDQSLKEMG